MSDRVEICQGDVTEMELKIIPLLVYVGLKGTQILRSHKPKHHKKLITGIVLVGLGIFTFFT